MFEKLIKKIENEATFNCPWYAILINPFYITRRQILLATKDFASTVSPKTNILDVGCGVKPYRKLFKTKNYVGIDVKGGGLKDEAKRVDKYFDGQNIPFPKGTFGVVIATEVLEHAQLPEKLISEMARVLKTGGKLFITMPFVWPEHGAPFDFQRFTSFQHKRILTNLGLKVVSVKPTTGVFGTSGQIISDFFHTETTNRIWKLKFRYGVNFLLVRSAILILCFPTQLIFELMDTIFKRRGITLDFVVIAKK